MPIRIADPSAARETDVTAEALYLGRRELLRAGMAAGLGALALGIPGCGRAESAAGPDAPSPVSPDGLRTDEPTTDVEAVTSYNNFYEFGTDKEDPARLAGALTTRPWSVRVDGEVARPGDVPLEDLLAP